MTLEAICPAEIPVGESGFEKQAQDAMVRENWKDIALGEVVTLQRGFDLPSQDRRAGTVPVVSSSGVSGTHDDARVKAPGVVTGRYGTLGEVYFVEADFWPLNTTLFVKEFKGNDPRFVYYLLKNLDFSAYSDKSSVPGLNRNHLHSMRVRVPSEVNEQRAIAHILGTLDDKIELNRQMNQTLEQIAAALFRSWFVDFDPVRAKAGGRQPEGMDAETAELFPDRLVESEIGEIPEGWGTYRIGDLLGLDKGLSYKGQYLTDAGVGMVNLGCFKGHGKFDESAIKNYSGEFHDRHLIGPGDLVLANTDITQKREVLGSPALVAPQGNGGKLIFTHHVFAARFLKDREPWRLFVYFSLLQQGFRERATGFATGTTVLALPRDAVLEYRIPAPPLALISVFDTVALSLIERQWKNSQQNSTLSALRDTLLPRLLSGEIRVPTDVLNEEAVMTQTTPEELLVQSRF